MGLDIALDAQGFGAVVATGLDGDRWAWPELFGSPIANACAGCLVTGGGPGPSRVAGALCDTALACMGAGLDECRLDSRQPGGCVGHLECERTRPDGCRQ